MELSIAKLMVLTSIFAGIFAYPVLELDKQSSDNATEGLKPIASTGKPITELASTATVKPGAEGLKTTHSSSIILERLPNSNEGILKDESTSITENATSIDLASSSTPKFPTTTESASTTYIGSLEETKSTTERHTAEFMSTTALKPTNTEKSASTPPSDPTTTKKPTTAIAPSTTPKPDATSKRLSNAAIVGITFGVIAVLIVGVIVFRKKALIP